MEHVRVPFDVLDARVLKNLVVANQEGRADTIHFPTHYLMSQPSFTFCFYFSFVVAILCISFLLAASTSRAMFYSPSHGCG